LVWSQVLQKGVQFLLHMWHPSCYSFHKPVIWVVRVPCTVLYYFCGCIVFFVHGSWLYPIISYDTPHISLRSNSNKLPIRMWHSKNKYLLNKVVLLSLALKRYYWNNLIANIMRRFRNQESNRTQLNDFCRSNYYYMKGSMFCLSF